MFSGPGPEYGCASSPTVSPVARSPTVVPAPTPIHEDETRLIAYLGNWQACPTTDQLAAYTHIVIAFAVSYTWSPDKNICSATCAIETPPVCNNGSNQALIDEWRSLGKKVILSFGGAGMGGSWDGDPNDCWEYCYGRESAVTDNLVQIVNEMNLDGVDLDFEYHVTPAATIFLNQVTTGLKNKLAPGSEVTHAPMDSDIMPGKPYYDDVLKVTGHQLDFLMPQYYNGFTRPAIDGVDGTGAGSISALWHYANIVNDIYGGDAKRMVFGFCINACSGTGSNANAMQASTVMTDLANTYACNGGAFFWVVNDDTAGSWSSTVGSTLNNLASANQCSSLPNTNQPTQAPTKPPTLSLPTMNPSKFPTQAPTKTPTKSPTTTPTIYVEPSCEDKNKSECQNVDICQWNNRDKACSSMNPPPAPTPTVVTPAPTPTAVTPAPTPLNGFCSSLNCVACLDRSTCRANNCTWKGGCS